MDNTLLDDDDPPRIKLCDFGFAKWWTELPHMSTITGGCVHAQQLEYPCTPLNMCFRNGCLAKAWC
jgi:serine/threonine protein kinase